jgi:uncharacterized protein
MRGLGMGSLGVGALFVRRTGWGSASRLVARAASPVDLAPGLEVRVIERVGESMDDGVPVPGLPDGMGLFENSDGHWVLMRNHELPASERGPLPGGGFPPEAYRPGGGAPDSAGGVTRLVVDPKTLTRVRSNGVLAGTQRNCSGGVSPWGWLSCEETVAEGHGYVFLAPADAESWVPARPIRGYGRFHHEAVAVGPDHVAYLTEDRKDGCLYRFVPERPERPFEGRLQALRVTGEPRFDTANGLEPQQSVSIDWIDVGDGDRVRDDLRYEAAERGAARICRGEGIVWHGDGVFFTATTGGPRGRGQVFRLRPEAGLLTLVGQSEDPSVLDCPDNLTVTPWGDVIVAEDGWGEQFIRGIRPDGTVYDLARNATSTGEFAGICLAPDSRTLFVNLQKDGLTVAIRGDLKGASRG